MKSYALIAEIFELMNEASDQALAKIINIAKTHECPLVRHEAVFALGEMAASTSVPVLKEIAENDDNYVVVHEALMAIGTIGSEEDVSFLKTFLEHDVYEIKTSAKIGIQRIQQEEQGEQMMNEYIKQLTSNTSTRNERIHSLFKLMNRGIKNEEARTAIGLSLMTDPCSIVRHEAGFVLGEIGSEECVIIMSQALQKETSPIVIHETLFALGTSGKRKALAAIEKFLDHQDYIIRESARVARDRILKLEKPYSGARHFAKEELSKTL